MHKQQNTRRRSARCVVLCCRHPCLLHILLNPLVSSCHTRQDQVLQQLHLPQCAAKLHRADRGPHRHWQGGRLHLGVRAPGGAYTCDEPPQNSCSSCKPALARGGAESILRLASLAIWRGVGAQRSKQQLAGPPVAGSRCSDSGSLTNIFQFNDGSVVSSVVFPVQLRFAKAVGGNADHIQRWTLSSPLTPPPPPACPPPSPSACCLATRRGSSTTRSSPP